MKSPNMAAALLLLLLTIENTFAKRWFTDTKNVYLRMYGRMECRKTGKHQGLAGWQFSQEPYLEGVAGQDGLG